MTAMGLASKAEMVLDPRLAEVWQLIWAGDENRDEVSEEVLAGLLRLAYMQGYADASAEPDSGALYRELGIQGPSITRKEAARPLGAPRRPGSSGR
ncbi:MAG: hypothetical protein WEB06_02650 [Actinomycetota bacterium]